MPLKPFLYAAAMAMPTPWKSTEAPADRHERLGTIATAIATEVPDRKWQAATLALFWHESRLASDIHSGKTRGDDGRAICLGQHWKLRLSQQAWASLAGTDLAATRRCAALTFYRLKRAHRWCAANRKKPGMAAAYSLYATGSRCDAPLGKARAATFRWVLNMLPRDSS